MKSPELLTPELQKVVSVIPPDVMEDLRVKMATFEQALLVKDPQMPYHMKMSHQLLISYPETVQLLDDTEIAKLLQGAEELMRIEVVSKAVKGKGASKKKMGVDDL